VSLLRVSWRNLWRNRRRTAITMSAIALNTLILITTYSLMGGFLKQTVRNVTQLATGEAQLHAPGYLSDRSLYKRIAHPRSVLQALGEHSIGAAPRTYGYGLVSRGTKSAGALFQGVEPAMETAAFELAGHLAQGTFLAPAAHKGLVLGRKLAKSLNAEVGSEIVVLVQAADGSLGNDLFTVVGILGAVGEAIDRNAAMMHLDDFRQLFAMPEGIHEIAVNTRGRLPLDALVETLSRLAPGDEVRTWRRLLPTFSDMIELSGVSMSIFGAIFLIAAGLGVMNTMLMATYERAREFALQKALGATPWRIVRDVTFEAWLLACVATMFGTLAGLAASFVLQTTGLNTASLAGETTISGVVFDPVWRADLTVRTVVWPVFMMWAVCVLAALYPAAMCARLDPGSNLHFSHFP